MPTAKRQVYDNAIYHIVQRGNNRRQIFFADKDYGEFLILLKDYTEKYPSELYNYCLMGNHIHLLLKVFDSANLSKLMQGLFQSYRFYYKKAYKYTGYLYQGRYKSKIIEKNEYLLECARYIETNPLRAGVVERLRDYKWSSYRARVLGEPDLILDPIVL